MLFMLLGVNKEGFQLEYVLEGVGIIGANYTGKDRCHTYEYIDNTALKLIILL